MKKNPVVKLQKNSALLATHVVLLEL